MAHGSFLDFGSILIHLRTYAVVSGIYHPAESDMEELLKKDREATLDWLLYQIVAKTDIAADALAVFGRCDFDKRVMRVALESGSLEIRDTAVCYLAERYPEGMEMLKTHNEPVAWLAEYIKELLNEQDTK